MNRQQFNSKNNVGQIFTFQKSGSTNSFDPIVSFSSGSRRVSWRLNNGSSIKQIAGNSITYNGFSADTAIRTIEMRSNNFKGLSDILIDNDNLYGNIDLTCFDNLLNPGGNIILINNPMLTGITNPAISGGAFNASFSNYQLESCNIIGNLDLSPISGAISSLIINGNSNLTAITFSPSTIISDQLAVYNCDLRKNLNLRFTGSSLQAYSNSNLTGITHLISSSRTMNTYNINSCNITGSLDLSPLLGLGGVFQATNNPNLTNIIHTASTVTFTMYNAYNCDLTGNLNLPFTNLGGDFRVYTNSNLTGITHTSSSQIFTRYQAHDCNLIGNLNLPFPNLGGIFTIYNNSNLTGITHTGSSQNFTSYQAYNCNLIGNLNLTPLSGLGGSFNVSSNPNLTSITYPNTPNNFSYFNISSCTNLTGNLDLSPLSGFGGDFYCVLNPNITGITHPNTSNNFSVYNAQACNLTGTLDLTPLSGFGRNSPLPATTSNSFNFRVDSNPNLTNILFPTVTTYFRNKQNITGNGAFVMNNCNLNYVDFKPLSGATLLTGGTPFGNPIIYLSNNSMSAGDVNHILDDFLYNATNNPTGWSNINLNIGGTNANPDTSSGGYNGLAAIATLTGSPYNWTITY